MLASVYVKYTRGTNGSFFPSGPLRGFTVQTALLLPNLVLKEPTVLALLSVIGLNAPLVAEASIALEWDFQSPLEPAESVSTAERELSLLYANVITVIYSVFIQGFTNNFLYFFGSTNTNTTHNIQLYVVGFHYAAVSFWPLFTLIARLLSMDQLEVCVRQEVTVL